MASFVPVVSGDGTASSRGISLRGVRNLRDKVKELVEKGHIFGTFEGTDWVATDFTELTTTEFVYGWVKRFDVTGTERLADCATSSTQRTLGYPRTSSPTLGRGPSPSCWTLSRPS